MSNPRTSRGTRKRTSSPASEDGLGLYDSQDGQMMLLSGPVAARASRSRKPGSAKAPRTSATCGRSGEISSPSADLQSSLESRLRAHLDVNGSLEYVLKWKHWDMKSGPQICALRASARRISDKGCSGWRSPDANNRGGAIQDPAKVISRMEGGHQINLEDQAVLAGRATPTRLDSTNTRNRTAGRADPHSKHHDGQTLCDQVWDLAGWQTPTVEDAARKGSLENYRKYVEEGQTSGCRLRAQVHASGIPTMSSPAQTGKRGALNPRFSLWLMGFPAEWASSGERATQSSRKSRRRS